VSLRQAADALATLLSVGLWLGAVVVFGLATAIIWTMEPSSASQGGRYFVAVGALVALLFIDRQMTLLVRRRLPFSISTLPAERRYHRKSFLLLVAAGAFLLGLAHFRATGTSAGLTTILLVGVALAATPFVLAFVLDRFVKPIFDHGFDFVFGKTEGPSVSKTWSFSFGTPTATLVDPRSGPRLTRPLSPDRKARYQDGWLRIRDEFDREPVEAVRRAHALILELIAETGHSGLFNAEERIEVSDQSQVEFVLESSLKRVRNARDIQAAVQTVLAGGAADRDTLWSAMDEYERILERLLAGLP
jgi:hypothetical protein